MDPKKILIVSGCDARQEAFGQKSFQNSREYAATWGHDFDAYTGERFWFAYGDYFNSQQRRAPNWAKVSIIARNVQRYDYVLWHDADAFIVDHSKSLHDTFKLEDDDFVIKLAPDVEYLNVGVFLLNCNHPLTPAFLQRWTEMGVEKNEYFQTSMSSKLLLNQMEQGAFIELYKNNWNNLMPNTRILQPQIINAHLQVEHWAVPYQLWCQYQKGVSFILHLAGVPNEKRLQYWYDFIKPLIISR